MISYPGKVRKHFVFLEEDFPINLGMPGGVASGWGYCLPLLVACSLLAVLTPPPGRFAAGRYEGALGEVAGGDPSPNVPKVSSGANDTSPTRTCAIGTPASGESLKTCHAKPSGSLLEQAGPLPHGTAGYTALEAGLFFIQTENLSKSPRAVDTARFLLLLLLGLSLGRVLRQDALISGMGICVPKNRP